MILTLQEANRAKAREQERAFREKQLKEAQDASLARQKAIISDMTRQYKSTDEELREHQAQLQQRIDVNKIEIENLQKKKQEIEEEKRKKEIEKEEEIGNLTKMIETMHQNFAQMLKRTLEKMKERIKKANEVWQEEQDNKLFEKFNQIIENGEQPT